MALLTQKIRNLAEHLQQHRPHTLLTLSPDTPACTPSHHQWRC